MMIEQWKDIPGYEGLYKVSNIGNVFSIVAGKNIKPNIRTYRMASLRKSGENKLHSIYILMLTAFNGERPSGKHVGMHVDDDKHNDVLSNLKWGTYSENTKAAYGSGRIVSPFYKIKFEGNKNKNSKPVERLDQLGNVIEIFESAGLAAKKYNISNKNILRCCNGYGQTSGGYKWRFLSLEVPDPGVQLKAEL